MRKIIVCDDVELERQLLRLGEFEQAENVLKECGFRYYTVFEKRTAEFKKL